MLSCEFGEIFKSTFFCRTTSVTVSVYYYLYQTHAQKALSSFDNENVSRETTWGQPISIGQPWSRFILWVTHVSPPFKITPTPLLPPTPTKKQNKTKQKQTNKKQKQKKNKQTKQKQNKKILKKEIMLWIFYSSVGK